MLTVHVVNNLWWRSLNLTSGDHCRLPNGASLNSYGVGLLLTCWDLNRIRVGIFWSTNSFAFSSHVDFKNFLRHRTSDQILRIRYLHFRNTPLSSQWKIWTNELLVSKHERDPVLHSLIVQNHANTLIGAIKNLQTIHFSMPGTWDDIIGWPSMTHTWLQPIMVFQFALPSDISLIVGRWLDGDIDPRFLTFHKSSYQNRLQLLKMTSWRQVWNRWKSEAHAWTFLEDAQWQLDCLEPLPWEVIAPFFTHPRWISHDLNNEDSLLNDEKDRGKLLRGLEAMRNHQVRAEEESSIVTIMRRLALNNR